MRAAAKVFFDTQICMNAANGVIPEEEWREATDYIQEMAQYWISPLTAGEVILSIAKADEDHFDKGRERLRRLYIKGSRFFDFPRYFVAETLGLPDKRPAHLEDDFGFSIQVILLADSKRQLLEGVPLPYLTARVRIGIDRFQSEVEEIQQRYVRLLSTLRGKKKASLSPEEWAHKALSLLGIENDNTIRDRFLRALPAAYQFDMVLFDLARNTNFDPQRNVSDLIDTQQLCYLCDPAVVFVTNDTDHKNRLRGNLQAGRILTFRDVLQRARDDEPLLYVDQS